MKVLRFGALICALSLSVANSFELRQALEDHGAPVKIVLYDGFGHPINKPKQQRALMDENENWFGHYIFGEPLAPTLIPPRSGEGGERSETGGE